MICKCLTALPYGGITWDEKTPMRNHTVIQIAGSGFSPFFAYHLQSFTLEMILFRLQRGAPKLSALEIKISMVKVKVVLSFVIPSSFGSSLTLS